MAPALSARYWRTKHQPNESTDAAITLRAASRSSGTWKDNDFDALEDGVVVGLIFFLDAVGPQDRLWMWGAATTATHPAPTPTRGAAMAAFAKGWRRE